MLERKDCEGMKDLTPACIVQERTSYQVTAAKRGGKTPNQPKKLITYPHTATQTDLRRLI